MRKHLHLMMGVVMMALFSLSATAQSDITVVLDQNFDAFTEGSEDNPATVDISSYSSGKLRNTLTGWTGSRVYEAGGCLKIGNGGNLRTANTDMSSGGGNLRITFRVKTLDDVGAVDVQLGYNTATTFYLYDNSWTTIEYITSGGRSTSYLTFKPNFVVNGILIDDLKVETSESFLAAPVANLPTQADGTSFTALWKSVTGATGYLLNVYTKDGDTRNYVLQDQAVTGTSYQVTELNSAETYYFNVRAVKGDIISAESNEIEVVKVVTELEAPVALPATEVSEQGFTANWAAVPDALRYEVYVTRSEILAQDAMVNVIDEDFSRVTQGTITSVSYPSTQEYLDAYTQQPGWYGYSHCLAAGYMGIAPFSGAGTITTPALDLSNDDGNFTLKVNMVSRNYSGPVDGDKVTVNIYNGDQLVETSEITLAGDFADYVITSDKGSAETYIELSYLNGTDKLFIDYIQVAQQLKAGDTMSQLVGIFDAGNATSLVLDLPVTESVTYDYDVVAYANTVVSSYYGNYVDEIASEHSNPIHVQLIATAIGQVKEEAVIQVLHGAVMVGADATIYNLNGQILTRATAGSIVNLQPGFYVIKAGGQVCKVKI